QVSSCSKKTDNDINAFAKPGSKPQVIDYLRGKTSSQVLKIKYKALKAACTLETVKSVKGQANEESAGITPPADQPPISNNPPVPVSVENPTPESVTYDLKAQAQIDQDLKEQVKTDLTINIDNQTLKVDFVVKPISFQEYLSLDLNKKKYLMKYTPVLSYTYIFELIRGDLSTVGGGDGKIYEKVDSSNKIVTTRIGDDSYDFVLNCVLNREINPENPDMAAEFESQWVDINCQAPKNEEEVSVCAGS
ncbi:MAG: hypothetical protein ABL930_06190, partial [Pseudobdellovibrio sp.]